MNSVENLSTGDIVIIKHPNRPELMNMITEVIFVNNSKIVNVRGIGTTMNIERKYVTKIPIEGSHSIKIPNEPIFEKPEHSHGNKARFKEIPLSWFSYSRPKIK